MRQGPLRSYAVNGLLAGAAVALVLSIYTAQHFRSGLMTLPWLILWHAVSLLVGGAAGLAGGSLTGRLFPRATVAASYFSGALFGTLGFLLQMYLFLLIMFRNYPTSF